jgi:hypothetical protein
MRGTESVLPIVLPVFRATAIAGFAGKYPRRSIKTVAGAAYAAANIPTLDDTGAVAAAAYAAYAAASDPSASAAAAYGAAAAADVAAAAAARAPRAVAGRASVYAAVEHDARRLHDRVMTPEQLAAAPLWLSPYISGAWQGLARELCSRGDHWSVWIDWYDDVLAGPPHAVTSEAEDAAFTDIPSKLSWDLGAEAVNTEIARRLEALRESHASEPAIPASKLKAEAIARLAEVASPQPSITDKGQLDVVPNQPFDVPTVDDDLSTLPLRQCNLIRGILGDLPANAPKHLRDFLLSYDNELKARGAQPILGLLKDDADIIAAAAGAPRAEDEWLEPGMRKAFDRFGENHVLFVEHFPLDAEREAIYAQTPLNEAEATGKKLVEPFEDVAKAVQQAHKAGAATDDFLMAIDKMTELARILSMQPPPSPSGRQRRAPDEIKVLPADRIQPVSVKKRTLLGALGFFERTYNLIGSSVTITGYAGVLEALKPAIEFLSRLIR